MTAGTQRLEYRGPRQLRQLQAGQPAIGAKQRCAGPFGARTALVAVTVGDDADAVTEVEGVVDDPLEGAPARMHLDRGLDGNVVGDADVGVASADMRKGDGVLAVTLEGREQ